MTAVVTVLIAQFEEYFDDALRWDMTGYGPALASSVIMSAPVPAAALLISSTPRPIEQGVVKVFLELSNKNCDHGSHIPEVQLGEVSRLKLRV